MTVKTIPTDAAIGRALADLVVELQERRYGEMSLALNHGLAAWVDSFSRKLDEHLAYEEEVLFPALEDADPVAPAVLDGFKDDHGMFHRLIRDTADLLEQGNIAEAYETARELLARILEHSREETGSVGRIIRTLDPISAAALKGRLHPQEAKGYSGDSPDSRAS